MQEWVSSGRCLFRRENNLPTSPSEMFCPPLFALTKQAIAFDPRKIESLQPFKIGLGMPQTSL